MTYKVLTRPQRPGIENCRYPREQAAALTAHIKAGIGNRRKFQLSRSEPPAGSPPMHKPYRWGGEVETESKASKRLLQVRIGRRVLAGGIPRKCLEYGGIGISDVRTLLDWFSRDYIAVSRLRGKIRDNDPIYQIIVFDEAEAGVKTSAVARRP